jgi:hypothetical protein
LPVFLHILHIDYNCLVLRHYYLWKCLDPCSVIHFTTCFRDELIRPDSVNNLNHFSLNGYAARCRWNWHWSQPKSSVCCFILQSMLCWVPVTMTWRVLGLRTGTTLPLPYLPTYPLTYLHIPWCRTIFEKLIVTQLAKNILLSYGIRRFITVFTKVRHLILS